MSVDKDLLKFDIPENFKEEFEHKEFYSAVRDDKTVYALTTFPRVIPFLKDGLIEVYRKCLWSMYTNKLFWVDKYHVKKSAFVTGDVIGNWHPHGDQAAYQSMVSLAQDYTNNQPLIFGSGNWGTVLGDPAASPRYTECCLSEFFCDCVEQIKQEIVDFMPNYDGKLLEPRYIPFKIPVLLVNGSYGIADSYITSIPPHNVGDVVDICIKYIDNKSIRNDVLVDGFFPDMPNYGIIINKSEVEAAYKYCAPGNIKMKADIEIDRVNNKIFVHDLPYNVTKNDLMLAIKAGHDKKHAVISKINDASQIKVVRDGELHVDFEILFDRDSNILEVAREVEKMCNKTIPLSFVYYDGTYVHRISIKDIVEQWYKTLYTTKTRKINYQSSLHNHRKHILEGMVIVHDNLDEIIEISRNIKSEEELIELLSKKFDLTNIQAEAIGKMNISKLNRVAKDSIQANIDELAAKIAELDMQLFKIDDEIKADLLKIKDKYGRNRRTVVIDLQEKMKNEENKTIPLNNGALLWSHNQYAVFDLQNLVNGKTLTNGLKSVKVDGKNTRTIIGCHNISTDIIGIIVFSKDGTAKRIEAKDILHTNNWITYGDEPVISACVPIFSEEDKIIVIMSNNKMKTIPVESIGKMSSKIGDVACAQIIDKTKDTVMLVNPQGGYHMFPIEEIPELGRSAVGVAINIQSPVVYMTQIERHSDDMFITSLKDDEGYTYLMKTDQLELDETGRANNPKKLFKLEDGFCVVGVNHIDIRDKDSKCIMIGSQSSSQISIQNIRTSDMSKVPKRVPVGALGIVTYKL